MTQTNYNMKKVILNKIRLLIFPLVGLLTSCSSDSDTFGISSVTNYPTLKLIGDNPLIVRSGTSFTDPGVEAKENGTAIPYKASYSGAYRGGRSLDLNIADKYVANYVATNKDGFSATTNRSIYVYNTGDYINSVEGLYVASVKRNGSFMSASQGSSTAMKYVIVWKNTDGSYGVSDAIGGWYDLGRSYGVDYASKGLKFSADITNGNATVTQQPNGVGAFGGAISVNNISIDKINKKIVITSQWSSPPSVYDFVATLTQVN